MSILSARAPAEKLSLEKHFKLASSPHVRIHVGPEDEEKVYSLPKDLIAHYSPYFASYFKNNWKEGKEGILRHPEVSTEFLDVLRDYFRCGQAEYNPECKKATEDLPPALVKCENARKKRRLLKCFQFIQFTNKYDVFEAASAAEKCLH